MVRESYTLPSLKSDIRPLVADLAEKIRKAHIDAGQVASGRTLASIKDECIFADGSLECIIWGRKPFETLEMGRKAGKVPRNFVSIIRQWMEDKKIQAEPIPYVRVPSASWQPKYTPQERGNMSLAGAIAHKIATKGTLLHRMGGRSDIYSDKIDNAIEEISDKINSIFAVEVESININL